MSQSVHAIVMRRFNVSAKWVFAAWFDPVWPGRWMFGPDAGDERIVRLSLDPRVGGKFSFTVSRGGSETEHIGEYLALDRPQLLAFTWATGDCPPGKGRAIVEITPCDAGCDVKLTHVLGAGWSAYVDRAAETWTRMLDVLEQVIAEESGLSALGVSP
jgi:uncharacterized protein YndB with AHSA1/START domain